MQGVDVVVVGPDVQHSINDGGGGVHPIPCRVVPKEGPSRCVQSVDVVVVGPDVQHFINDGGRGAH